MAETHILRGGTLLADWSGAHIQPDGAVAWREGRIVACGTRQEVEAACPDAITHEAHGGWIAPGLINAHHHLYSALASGLDPGMPIDGFGQRLDRLWWRLDRAHDEASVRASVRVGALRSVMAGCTTVVDHHASPAVLEGVLDVVAEELEAAGLSAVLCYEASDRNGHAEALAGLRESARFRGAVSAHSRFRGLLGLHACFTLSDASLARAAELVCEGDVHIHVAEDALDVELCHRRNGMGPVQRLRQHGLLGPRAWIAHGVHLRREDLEILAEQGCLLVHNPESNANNQVGRLDLRLARASGLRVALGTDGMSPCMAGSLRSAFLLHRSAHPCQDAGWKECEQLLDGARPTLAAIFGEPGYSALLEGAPADVIALDAPFTPHVTQESLTAHLVFGLAPLRVRHTVARGIFLLRDYHLQMQDAERIGRESQPVRNALWSRFRATEAGTPYLGPAIGAAQEDL